MSRPNLQFKTGGGPLTVWEFPQVGAHYVQGADVAEGLEHGDYSSAHVINVGTGLVAAHWHGHLAPDLFGVELSKIGAWYNGALTGVEVNNHGLTTCVALQATGYPNIYWRMSLDQRSNTQSRKIGWRTSASTKPLMIDELAKNLRDFLTLRCGYTLAELRTFVRAGDGKMHGSPHDDRVVSLAIANQMLKYVFAQEYAEPQSDEFTLNWWARTIDDAKAAAGEWVIG